MNRLSKCLFIAAASIATTGVAFADDQPKPDDAGGGGGDAGAGGDAGGGAAAGAGATVGTDGAAATATGSFTADTWPKDYVNRPQNIYKGGIELSPRLDVIYTAGQDDGMGGTTDSSTVSALNVGGRYGITDKIEALASYNRIILTGVEGIEAGDRVKGVFTAGAGIVVLKGKFDVEVKAALQIDLGFAGVIKQPMFLLAGADVRYHLSEKMWIGTPINRPGVIFGLTNAEVLGMEAPDSKPFLINIPLAFAFQATPEFAIQANTDILQLRLNDAAKGGGDSAVTFIGTDEGGGIPLDIDFIFALSNKMDVQAKLNLGDLKNAGDAFQLLAGVNLRL